jgi:methylated-DNA-[protein]-cysteine S-methyltransferase
MTDLERDLAGLSVPDLDMDRFTAGLAERAASDALMDVAFAPVDSPMGELTVFVTPRGLVRLSYPNESMAATFDELSERVSPRILRNPAATDAVRRELDSYFEGRLHTFTSAVDWSLVHGFARGVLAATSRVPWGSVTTYRDMATEAGSPRAARAAGNALGSNPIPIVVPCHRVLHADGGLGGYSGGLDRKRFLLRLEGTLPARA